MTILSRNLSHAEHALLDALFDVTAATTTPQLSELRQPIEILERSLRRLVFHFERNLHLPDP